MDKASGLDGEDECNEFPRCKGLQLPKTTKNEKNVEVMRAWKTIRTDPNFKVSIAFIFIPTRLSSPLNEARDLLFPLLIFRTSISTNCVQSSPPKPSATGARW